MIIWSVIVLLSVFTICQLIGYLSTRFFIFDVFSSILPYTLIANLLLIVLVLTLSLKTKAVFGPVLIGLLFILTATNFLNSGRFLSFSYLSNSVIPSAPVVLADKQEKSQELKLASFNKLYSNTHYSDIDSQLNSLNPDILVITEIKDRDIPKIKSLNNYPYSLVKQARDNANITIFSKFPLERKPEHESPFVLAANTKIQGKDFLLFAVHPYPPATAKWTADRNNELRKVVEIIQQNTDNALIMGDFNISPWSKSYHKIFADLNKLKNASVGKGIQFTWHGNGLKTQIDHIFVPANAEVKTFKSQTVNGSDHNLIWTEISI